MNPQTPNWLPPQGEGRFHVLWQCRFCSGQFLSQGSKTVDTAEQGMSKQKRVEMHFPQKPSRSFSAPHCLARFSCQRSSAAAQG